MFLLILRKNVMEVKKGGVTIKQQCVVDTDRQRTAKENYL